jgi:putative DNA primase/helicase
MTPHGLQDATRDPTIITRWFRGHDDLVNLGAVTGSVARYWVLDVDPDKGGAESLAGLEAQHGPLPLTPTILTGGGGDHYLFAYPVGRVMRGRVGVRPGVDVRADDNYHILPPSLHVSGRRYAWELRAHPNAVPLAPAPPWLLDLVSTVDASPHAPLDLGLVLSGVPEGRRNDQLFRAACKLLRADVPYDYARTLTLGAAARCTPPLPEREALRALDSAYRRYAPRSPERPLFVVEVP